MTEKTTAPVIVFLEVEVEEWEEAILKRLCPPAWHARYYAEEADRIDLSDAQIISVFIYSDLDAAVLSQLPSLRMILGSTAESRMIATRSTGYDHIDMAYCRERNIVVSIRLPCCCRCHAISIKPANAPCATIFHSTACRVSI